MQVVFVNKFLRDIGNLDADILRPGHGDAKIEKFNLKTSKTRSGAREDIVENKFYKFE